MTGRFVVLEGGDGSGKSTQRERLVQWLRHEGVDVAVTHEPGATALGVALRALLLDGAGSTLLGLPAMLPHPENWRRHPDAQMVRVGFGNRPAIQALQPASPARSRSRIADHQRAVCAAKRRGELQRAVNRRVA